MPVTPAWPAEGAQRTIAQVLATHVAVRYIGSHREVIAVEILTCFDSATFPSC